MSNIEYLKDDSVSMVEEVISQYEIRVGDQKVGIKITLDENGYFQFYTSHFYHGSQQASPYIASAANLDSEKEALIHARRQITSFYDPNDDNAQWVKNHYF